MSASNLTQLVRSQGSLFGLFVFVGVLIALGVRSNGADEISSTSGGSHDSMDMGDASGAKQDHSAHDHSGQPMASVDTTAATGDSPSPGTMADGAAQTQPEKNQPAQTEPETTAMGGANQGVLLQLGNGFCPVMGGEIDGEIYSEWSGLRVEHCCDGCSTRFLKNPESLLDEVSPDWRKAVEAAQNIDAASGAEREALLEAADKRWKVLREPTGTAVAEALPVGGLLVDVGNTLCPVMGGDIDGETTSSWNGMRVNHCCDGCPKRFLKDPETLLDDVSTDWRQLRDLLAKFEAAAATDRDAVLAAIRGRWTVVREPTSDEG